MNSSLPCKGPTFGLTCARGFSTNDAYPVIQRLTIRVTQNVQTSTQDKLVKNGIQSPTWRVFTGMRASLLLLGVMVGLCLSAQAGTNYTIVIVNGYNAIANQLDNGSNTLNEVLPNVADSSLLYKWNPAQQGYGVAQEFFQGLGWIDTANGGPSTVTLAPGEGAILNNPLGTTNLTFTGEPHNFGQFPNIACDGFYFLSRQSNAIGTFENITGLTPEDGSQLLVFNNTGIPAPSIVASNFTVYVFCGGGWVPSLPMVPVGRPAFIFQPCARNGCITLTPPTNIVVMSSTFIPVNFQAGISAVETCAGNSISVFSRPASGSIFGPGSTPVHCIALDSGGNVVGADFFVTVAPPPITAPIFSNSIALHTGLNLIANQFIRGGNNLSDIMPSVPNGSVVTKFNNNTFSWQQSTFNSAAGGWSPANIVLNPGEGAFFNAPVNFNLKFSGVTPVPVLPITISNGIALLSQQTNGTANYETIIGSTPVNGVALFKLGAGGVYNRFTYSGSTGTWLDAGNNVVPEPTVAPAESCWISTGTNPPTIPTAPQITQQPSNAVAFPGAGASFTVAATGTAPLTYQWRHNSQAIAGATNSILGVGNITPASCGTYSATVINSIGLATSSNAILSLGGLTFLPFSDNFASSPSLGSVASGMVSSSNVGATVESGEPSPGFIPGGASVWLRWTCPSNQTGIASFSLAGSSFDTLIAVYTGPTLSALTPVVFDDDSAGGLNSSVSFNAKAGTEYQIQIDGFYGGTGQILLSWDFVQTSFPLPTVVTQPQSVTVGFGAPAQFSVSTAAGITVHYQWLKDGQPLNGDTLTTLTLPAVDQTMVGQYQVQMVNGRGGPSILSFPAELQINDTGSNSPPITTARAEDKFFAASDPIERPGDPYDPSIVTGYTCTQVFGTFGASTDPGEPAHCGLFCTFTKWSPAYNPPANALVTIANAGTTFAGVLAVYTGPAGSYPNIAPVACSSGHGVGGEICSFQSTGATYWIMMGATNITNGTVKLQYTTTTPPFFTVLPISQGAGQGSDVMLTTMTTGNPAATYQWRLNGTNVSGANTTSLNFGSFQPTNQGNYSIVAANIYGTNIFNFASVYLDSTLHFVNTTNIGSNFFTQLVGLPNSNYDIQVSSNLSTWNTVQSGSSATGIQNYIETNYLTSNRLFRGKLVLPP